MQDDQLLADLMEEHLHADWTELTALFNAHALGKRWPQRSECALKHRAARTQNMSLIMAAAAQRLSTSKQLVTPEMLQPFVHCPGTEQLSQLREFVGSCSMLLRDSVRKRITVMELLQALADQGGHVAGSDNWLGLLHQQDEIASLLQDPWLLLKMQTRKNTVSLFQVLC